MMQTYLGGITMNNQTTTLGELISVLFETFLEEFQDEELAAAAAAATLNRWLAGRDEAWTLAA